MGRLELFVLGPPRVALDGSELRLDTRKTLALLIYLAVTRERYRREALVNLLWPDSEERGGRSLLRNSLSVIRKSIGADPLDADATSVSVSAKASLWCDQPRFRSLLVKRIDQRGAEAAGRYRRVGGGIRVDRARRPSRAD